MVEACPPTLVLASASPRRAALLRGVGLAPTLRPADVDETRLPGEQPAAMVLRVAVLKASAAGRGPDEVVLAADTTVVCAGTIYGKPGDAHHAATTLQQLAGRAHQVCTGVAVIATDDVLRTALVTTRVWLAALDAATIAEYVATGEPLDKAGGYAIQGRGAAFVTRIDGSYTNVVGLPVPEALALLHAAGVCTS